MPAGEIAGNERSLLGMEHVSPSLRVDAVALDQHMLAKPDRVGQTPMQWGMESASSMPPVMLVRSMV